MVLSHVKYTLKMMMKLNSINPHLHLIKTRKYKDINIYLRFSISYTPNKKACVLLLSKLFSETSLKYQDKTAMAKAKDMLYGLDVNSGFKVRSNIITFNVNYSFINPKFVDINLSDYVDFVKETLYNTTINEKNLAESKRNAIAKLKRRLDKPQILASEKVVSIIGNDNKEFKAYSLADEFIKELEKVNLKDVLKLYQYLLHKAQLDVYICGDINKNIINEFNFDFENRESLEIKPLKLKFKNKGEIVDKKNIKQSTLDIVYKAPFNKKHPDYYAFILGNIFLGSLPTSLLFEEVREKLGLCYSISIFDYRNEGIVIVYTDIDGKNKDLVISEVNKQINRLINKDYDDAKLKMAKTLFMNILDSSNDDIDSLIEFYQDCILHGLKADMNLYKKKINAVSKLDISRVFKQYQPYFTYVLKGDNDEKTL